MIKRILRRIDREKMVGGNFHESLKFDTLENFY